MSGTILPLKDAQEISNFVRNFPVPEGQKPVAMHLDAARLFDGVAGEGVDLKEYCKCFDSMSICLAKGLGAPMGSVILGSKAFIQRAKWFRKMVGGGARQVWLYPSWVGRWLTIIARYDGRGRNGGY